MSDAEWVGRVTLEGAEQAAAGMEKVAAASKAATEATAQQGNAAAGTARSTDSVRASISSTTAALRSYHAGGMLVAGMMSGSLETAITSVTASMGGMKESFRAAPIVASIALIGGALVGLGLLIRERMQIPLRAARENLEKLKDATKSFAEVMGNTPTARAKLEADAVVNLGRGDTVQDRLSAAVSESLAARRRAEQAMADGDGRGVEIFTEQLRVANEVVAIWQDAEKRIAQAKQDESDADARRQQEQIDAVNQLQEARAREAKDYEYFTRRADELQRKTEATYGREGTPETMTAEEAKVRAEIDRLRKAARDLESQQTAEAKAGAVKARDRRVAGRDDGPQVSVGGGDLMGLYDAERAAMAIRTRKDLGGDMHQLARSRDELLRRSDSGFAMSKAELLAMRAAGTANARDVRATVIGSELSTDTGVVIRGEALTLLRTMADNWGLK